MGCDYYVSEFLELTYINGTTSTTELAFTRCWYDWYGPKRHNYADDYHDQVLDGIYNQYIEHMSTPHSDIVIYENGNFLSDQFKAKYSRYLINNVVTIIKREERS